jgi:sugar-specific transcriptional regulator TrmB
MPTHNLLIKQLVEFGLSEKEARVYLALLELEVAAVSEIAKTAEVNRSSAYVVLESLKKKGLVSVSGDKKIQNYVAVSPELLLHEAENRAKKTQDLKNKINNILSELKALHKDTKHRPKVMVFEGKSGLREVYWDILKTPGANDLRVFADPARIFNLFPDFMNQNIARIKKGIKMYAINPATKESINLLKMPLRNSQDEFALIPKNKFNFSSDIAIWGDKIGLASPREQFGIIIENKEIAEMLRNSFELAWQEAKRLAKKRSLYKKMPGIRK